LVEVTIEELPSSYIDIALKQMKGWAKELFAQNNLTYNGDISVEGTLRRLVLFVEGLPECTPPRTEKVRGPAVQIAFADGKPTKAAIGFARKLGISPEELQVEEGKDGAYCIATVEIPGRQSLDICSSVVPQILLSIRFPKSMKWDKSGISFARPIRRILALLGDKVVPMEVGSLKSSNMTAGHPFAAPKVFSLEAADFMIYSDSLKKAFVIVRFEERKKLLRERLLKSALSLGAFIKEDGLLDEVTNMVEYPSVGVASFEEKYLSLPQVILEAVIKENMKYFPLYNSLGLLNSFLFVVDRPETSIEKAKVGNERVVNARLEDARFYFERDRKKRLKEFSERLKEIVFQEALGTYADVTSRLVWLTEIVVERLKFPEREKQLALEAASLLKVDLATQMVAEFPSLQGIIGGEYARLDGLDPSIVDAISRQYLSARTEEEIPTSSVSAVVSLVDRVLHIVGFWAIGAAPTGTKDPFAIRRHVLSVIRILEATGFDLDILELLASANQLLPEKLQRAETMQEVADFFRERLRNYLIEGGCRYDFADAVLSVKRLNVKDAKDRLNALLRISQEGFWRRLCETVERTFKISRKESHTGDVDVQLLVEDEERKLYDRYISIRHGFDELVSEHKYYEASVLYHNTLSDAVHDFFDKVFVYVDDEKLRKNRILLCLAVHRLYAENIADISKILFEPDKKP